jgi:hypothetical protein
MAKRKGRLRLLWRCERKGRPQQEQQKQQQQLLRVLLLRVLLLRVLLLSGR